MAPHPVPSATLSATFRVERRDDPILIVGEVLAINPFEGRSRGRKEVGGALVRHPRLERPGHRGVLQGMRGHVMQPRFPAGRTGGVRERVDALSTRVDEVDLLEAAETAPALPLMASSPLPISMFSMEVRVERIVLGAPGDGEPQGPRRRLAQVDS